MSEEKMTSEVVLSPVKDEKINTDIKHSPIWQKAYHPEEVTEAIRNKHNTWYEYTINFKGLEPVFMTKFKER